MDGWMIACVYTQILLALKKDSRLPDYTSEEATVT